MGLRVVLALAILTALNGRAAAYFDPGTGSLLLQMLIAGALTAAASIKLFWYRIKDVAQRLLGLKSKPPSTGQ
jgi:hypothetical protein